MATNSYYAVGRQQQREVQVIRPTQLRIDLQQQQCFVDKAFLLMYTVCIEHDHQP